MGRNVPRLFVEKKIASAQRIVLASLHHGLNQAYVLFDEKGLKEKIEIESTHENNIMSQVTIKGYCIMEYDGENKILLYNQKTNGKMISPELPSVNTVNYVGHCADTFTLLSLVLRDYGVVEEVWVLIFNAEFPQWTKVDTTNLRTLKIRNPNETCVLIDDTIYFSAYLYVDDQTIDVNSPSEDLVVSFGLKYHNLQIFGLPNAMISFRHKSFVKLQGDLAVVVYNNLRTSQFEIWRRETTWYKRHTSSFPANFWEQNEQRGNEYRVSVATSNGVLVLIPTIVRRKMQTTRPVYAFMYNPFTQDDVIPLNISWTNLTTNLPILAAVDYEV